MGAMTDSCDMTPHCFGKQFATSEYHYDMNNTSYMHNLVHWLVENKGGARVGRPVQQDV